MTATASTRLVIADDHPLFRDALRQAVASGDWPTARFDGAATSDPELQRSQLPAWQEPMESVVPTLSL